MSARGTLYQLRGQAFEGAPGEHSLIRVFCVIRVRLIGTNSSVKVYRAKPLRLPKPASAAGICFEGKDPMSNRDSRPKRRQTRRGFLKNTAGALAGGTLLASSQFTL